MVDLIWMVINSAVRVGIDKDSLMDYMQKVQDSNYSKFCTTEECAKETVRLYQVGEHPDKPGYRIPANYRKVNNKYVIYREVDGKILKCKDYIKL